ncbi:TPA: transcriptional regulator [Clostridium botulinum]|nr:transcriptional regulator [Clostridium botulinum]HDK7179181.1 transcriptional regulator [Clostridium botulinum]HDK7223508.1 transcriptional regulator [Clostridium botulinum]HDK7271160.1 transcriptional regulator [Clostridium botulinum]HDK7304516.1 transcriptional regulator [Clostridium botulinum]
MNNSIQKIRIINGLGLNETARKAGITGGYLSALEKGKKQNPSLETLIKLSRVLNVSINELLDEEFFRDELVCDKEISIGEEIKLLRKEKGITQEELAKHIGVSTSMVGMYETNARKPSYEVLSKIAKYFRVSTDYLLGETDSNIHKEIFMTLTREEFKNLTDFILDESSKENNNISIFTQDGLIKVGIDRVHTEVISEYKGEKVVLNE